MPHTLFAFSYFSDGGTTYHIVWIHASTSMLGLSVEMAPTNFLPRLASNLDCLDLCLPGVGITDMNSAPGLDFQHNPSGYHSHISESATPPSRVLDRSIKTFQQVRSHLSTQQVESGVIIHFPGQGCIEQYTVVRCADYGTRPPGFEPQTSCLLVV
jgi:hypothetical protein